VLEYDDVMSKQRETVYSQRRKVLERHDLRDNMLEMLYRQVDTALDTYADEKIFQEDWDLVSLGQHLAELTHNMVKVTADDLVGKNREELREFLQSGVLAAYEEREQQIGSEQMRELERYLLLRVMDKKWMEHLRSMDDLRQGIGLRAYGQRDPLLEYQFEAYEMFQAMMQEMQEDVVQLIFRVRLVSAEQRQQEDRLRQAVTNREGDGDGNQTRVPQRRVVKIGRNDPCPCGSGKKYKKCCGK
jgi:preprotein translocase subunit SecA